MSNLSPFQRLCKWATTCLLFGVLFFSAQKANCQDSLESIQKEKKIRTAVILGATGGAYIGTMAVLSTYWYGDMGQTSSFRWFNDNAEWSQVDKFGHAWSGYQITRASAGLYRWAHHSRKQALLYGAITGIVLMTPIEILDGYAESYGASGGDLVANLLGVGIFAGQELLWSEERIKFKFSFHTTDYAPQRPDVLGSGLGEEILKDYNGQTYWLSFDLYSFTGKQNNWLRYINPAFGYGAENMLYGSPEDNQQQGGLNAYRQFYFSLDPSFTHLKTRSKILKTIIFLVDAIKIPSPTLEFSEKGIEFHPFYF